MHLIRAGLSTDWHVAQLSEPALRLNICQYLTFTNIQWELSTTKTKVNLCLMLCVGNSFTAKSAMVVGMQASFYLHFRNVWCTQLWYTFQAWFPLSARPTQQSKINKLVWTFYFMGHADELCCWSEICLILQNSGFDLLFEAVWVMEDQGRWLVMVEMCSLLLLLVRLLKILFQSNYSPGNIWQA